MTLAPQIEGSVPIQSAAGAFVDALRRRVADGLLQGRLSRRSNYRIEDAGAQSAAVTAADWWSALNVGLNQVWFDFPQPGFVRYRVQYWRWAGYVLAMGAVFGLIGIVSMLAFDVRSYIAEHPGSVVRGLSIDQNMAILWAMIVFWGFLWPWLLVQLHKAPLRRLLVRIIAQIDASAAK